MLAEHDLVRLEPDVAGVHDLVGRALLQDTILVNPGLVCEGVSPHNCLVRLDAITGEAGDHSAGPRKLTRVHLRVEAMNVAACPKQHHDLLERAISGPLSDPIDRALHLTGARQDASVRVSDGQAEVVVAVN